MQQPLSEWHLEVVMKTLLSEILTAFKDILQHSWSCQAFTALFTALSRVLCSPDRRVLEGSPCDKESTPLDSGARVRVAGKHLLHQAFCLRDDWLTKAPARISRKLPDPRLLLIIPHDVDSYGLVPQR